MSYLARHILIDLNGCPFDILNDTHQLEQTLRKVIELLDTEILSTDSYQFEPQGISTVMIIGSSHIAIHSWPEHGYASVDVMVCTDNFRVKDIVDILTTGLQSDTHSFMEVRRGLIE